MNERRKRKHDPNVLATLAPTLLADPLDYILADHHRQRELFALCDDLAGSEELDLDRAECVADFLEHEMAAHMKDEIDDLLPMVRNKCNDTDENAVRVIGLLAGENQVDKEVVKDIATEIRKAIRGARKHLPEKLRNALFAFSDRQRRHLALENAVVVPLAQRLLSATDLSELTRRMAIRRSEIR